MTGWLVSVTELCALGGGRALQNFLCAEPVGGGGRVVERDRFKCLGLVGRGGLGLVDRLKCLKMVDEVTEQNYVTYFKHFK